MAGNQHLDLHGKLLLAIQTGIYHLSGITSNDQFCLSLAATRHESSAITFQRIAYLFLAVVGIVVSGCGEESPTAAVSVSTVPVPTEVLERSTIVEESPILESEDRQLVVWAPPFFQPAYETTINDPLTTLAEQFEREHPGVHIDVQIHGESGESSIFQYLRGAQRLAPTILPDVILIDTQQLWQVAELEMLMPLGQTQLLAETEFLPQFFAATTYREQIIGIPYMVDLTHLLYRTEQMPVVPSSWESALALQQQYIFAGGKGEGINEFVYLQYLGAGGTFSTEEMLTEERLHDLFLVFSQAHTTGVFPPVVMESASHDRAWNTFAAADLGMVETSARIALEHWDAINHETIDYGQIPTLTGIDITLARVWAFAVIATDPEQRELSLTLLAAFLDPTIHNELSHLAMRIPAQPTAFEIWRGQSPYFDFLKMQIDHAVALPNGRRFVELNRRLQQALELLLRDEISPEEAALYVQTQ